MWRIGLFYVGSVTLLVLLIPLTAYKAGVSPCVTFFGALGVPGIGTAMNLVVLTAALSSLNSGLYSTGRVLRSLGGGRFGAAVHGADERAEGPLLGIAVTLAIYVLGVVLNYLIPSQVFEVVLNIASLGIVSTWAFIVVCQMKLRGAQNRSEIEWVAFRLPFAPLSAWLTLVLLAAVLVLMAFDYPAGTFTIAAIPVVAICLGLGWFATKRSYLSRRGSPGRIRIRPPGIRRRRGEGKTLKPTA